MSSAGLQVSALQRAQERAATALQTTTTVERIGGTISGARPPVLAPNEGSAQRRACPDSPSASTSKRERGGRRGGSNTHRASKPLQSLLLARLCLETPEKPPILRLRCLFASLPPLRLFLQSGTDQDVRGRFFFSLLLQLQLTRRLRWLAGIAAPLLLVLPVTHESSRPPESSREADRVRARPPRTHASFRSCSRHGTRLLR